MEPPDGEPGSARVRPVDDPRWARTGSTSTSTPAPRNQATGSSGLGGRRLPRRRRAAGRAVGRAGRPRGQRAASSIPATIRRAGPVAAVVVDAPEPARLAGFWAAPAAGTCSPPAATPRWWRRAVPGPGSRLIGRRAQGGQEPLAPGRGPGRRRRPGRRGRPAEGARGHRRRSARARTTPGRAGRPRRQLVLRAVAPGTDHRKAAKSPARWRRPERRGRQPHRRSAPAGRWPAPSTGPAAP